MRVVLKGLFWLLIVLAGVFVAGGLMLPDATHVERSVVIQRPPSQVFAVLNGFARFNEWSPWLAYDPAMKTRTAGPATGIGAELHWTSDQAGSGSQQIIEVETDRLVVVALEFIDHGEATARYALTPEGEGGTKLVWSFDSNAEGSLIERWKGLMFERMVGDDYERGLAKLKQLVESSSAPQPVAAPADAAAAPADPAAAPADAVAPADAAAPDATDAPAVTDPAPAEGAAPAEAPAAEAPAEEAAAPPQG